MGEEESIKEQRIRKITSLYYSRSEIQKAIFSFSNNRETVPRYFEGFGKRPDALQYQSDVFELAKKGATSFHCSEELWEDPLKLELNLPEQKIRDLRIGWDLIIDIDSKYADYSKVMAKLILKTLNFHGVKNIGIKFSGSKGFHLIIPWQAFPKEVNGVKTASMFPEWPRIILKYINSTIEKDLVKEISNLEKPGKYVRNFQASKEVIPDLVLVAPRHLFRAPYSLHEKTALASVVILPKELDDFDLKSADPMKINIRNFIPEVKKGEASELLVQALDWYKEHAPKENSEKHQRDFQPIKFENLSDTHFPPSIKTILLGVGDGRKRALFVLINFFRAIGVEKDELEKRIEEWNKKNKVPLLKGYIQAQLAWAYRNKTILPPNYDKDYYAAIGAVPTEDELKLKNPVNYLIKKNSKGIRKQ
ncbi:hypothetical protein HYT23_00155 [Candidatus Pacearchaeota archaeon]|nr:hypothetical protein [Candidatus Pacearchaeota archaeon]